MKKSIYYSLIIGMIFQLFSCGNQGEKVVHIHQYDEKKQLNQQIAYLDEIIDDDDENAHAYFLKAKLYAQKNDYDQALKVIKTAINIEPKFPNYYLLQGELFYKVKNWEKALEATSNAEELGMQQIEMYEMLAKIHTELKQTTDAEHYINRISQLDPFNYNLNFLRAMNSYYVSDTLYAVRRFQLAIKDQLNTQECLVYLAKIHLARKEYASAITQIDKAIELIDNPVELICLKSQVIRDQGLVDSSYSLLVEAWEQDTLNKRLVLEIANINSEMERYWTGLFYLDKLVNDSSFNVELLRGDLHFKLRNYTISSTHYQKALQFQKETEYISEQLGQIDWKLNYRKMQRTIRDSIKEVENTPSTDEPLEVPEDSL